MKNFRQPEYYRRILKQQVKTVWFIHSVFPSNSIVEFRDWTPYHKFFSAN